MAKLALTWPESLPPPEEKRDIKVVRLLRDGDAGLWGATEARSSYVYPVSLRPLRKIAGVVAGESSGVGLDQTAGVKEPVGLDVSQLLEQVFPAATEVSPRGNNSKNETSNGHNTTTTNNNNDNNTTGNEAVPSNITSPLHPPGSGKRGKGKGKTRTAVKPVFHAYGSANTAPSTGGVVYGGYMLSHSICPQVFPNKPKTRQVHSGTQRVAVRAAAKARATSANTSRIGSGTATAATTRAAGAVRMGSSSSRPGIVGRDGGHVRGFRRQRVHGRPRGEKMKSAPTGAGGKGGVEAVGAEDNACRSSAAISSPLTLFNALPDDTEPWGATKTGRAAATTEDCRSGSNSPVSPTIVVGDAACAFKEKHNTESHPAAGGVDEQAGVAPCSDERPAQQQQQHEWTVDPHLANDPRNYKLLPRGWAGELIIPAGITGPRPSSAEAFIPGWVAGRTRKATGVGATSTGCYRGGGGDECGVGDCLRWNPGS